MDNWHFIQLANEARLLGAELISPFGYGEPLMDETLDSKIKYCTNLKLDTFITTNGGALSLPVTYALLNAGLSKIRFSVHGFGANYEKVQRGLDFGETMRNISNFLQVNYVKFDNACRTAVTVIPQHGETVEEIREFWETVNHVDEIEIWRPHNWVYGKAYREIPIKDRLRTCGRPQRGPVQIQADGLMVPCCFDYDGRMLMGDTHKQSTFN
jgi:molybdenum cofactor biosynthesis enzyme MoaA